MVHDSVVDPDVFLFPDASCIVVWVDRDLLWVQPLEGEVGHEEISYCLIAIICPCKLTQSAIWAPGNVLEDTDPHN